MTLFYNTNPHPLGIVEREVNRVISNRSVPIRTLLPHIAYPDVAEAIAWLTKTFGFSEHYRYGEPGGPVGGAQMHLGNAWIMLKRARPGSATPAQLGYGTQSLTVFLEDVYAHFQRAKSTGARIVEDLHETVYGERQYGVEDLAGHHWLFSWHARDLSPDEWGAVVSEPAIMTPQISPMLAVGDGNAAIEFYKAAFGATVLWHLEGGEHVVAGLSVHGAEFFLAHESPAHGTRGPAAVGFTTARIELFVDDPVAVHSRALPREVSSEVRWSNTSTLWLDRARSDGCCKVPRSTPLGTCGLSERSSSSVSFVNPCRLAGY